MLSSFLLRLFVFQIPHSERQLGAGNASNQKHNTRLPQQNKQRWNSVCSDDTDTRAGNRGEGIASSCEAMCE